jgi:transcriptional regulator with XRE-family HTH domain
MAVDRVRRSTEEWEAMIGAEVRAARIAANLDQSELARRADISLGAVKNLEAGKGSSLKTLVRVVRALGRTEWLESLTPPITVSPVAMLSSKGSATRTRQRVSRRRATAKRET